MNIGKSDKWTLATRSEVRRTAKQLRPQNANYLIRYLIIGGCIFVPFFIWHGIQNRFFAFDGPFSFLYRFHDNFYLWFIGNTWTAMFPYAFIWFLPVAFAVLLFVLEYLTPLKFSKIVQRLVTKRLLKMRIGRRLLRIGYKPIAKISDSEWENELKTGEETIKLGTGFSKRVLFELQTSNRVQLLNAFGSNIEDARKEIRLFFRLAKFKISLGAIGPAVMLGILEILVIYFVLNKNGLKLKGDINKWISFHGVGNKSDKVRTDFLQIKTCFDELLKNEAMESFEAAKIVIKTNELLVSRNNLSTCELATKFLRAVHLILIHKLPEGRDFLESWTICRLGENCDEVVQAERLLHISFWAMQIESMLKGYQLQGLSAQLWPNTSRLASAGEEFAWTGRLKND